MKVAGKSLFLIYEFVAELVAAHGLVLASTAGAGSGGNVSEATLPSMMKLAMCCAVKEGGTSRAVNRAT